ncbi:hypothetical protein [Mammaliicoccus sciuri]|nr:hypothetical protein [Mammaliicoccus sciuri]WQK43262.1 hypothetical protein P3T89_04390 [Mammaliicoccus sciuri]
MKLKVLKITLLIIILVEEIRSVKKRKIKHGIKSKINKQGSSIEVF